MAEIIPLSFAFYIVTNKYFKYLPILLGKPPGDVYYPIVKNLLFFIVSFLITLSIFYFHNNNKLNLDDLKKRNLSLFDVTLSDTLTIMLIVFSIYFAISILPIISIPKIMFESKINTALIVIIFSIVSLIYTLITDSRINYKYVSTTKNVGFSIGLFILFFLFVLYDDQISGSIPGFGLIPPKLKTIINIALQIENGVDIKSKIIANQEAIGVSNEEINNLLFTANLFLKHVPSKARFIIDKIKDNQEIIEKIFGSANSVEDFKQLFSDPLVHGILDAQQQLKEIITSQAAGISTSIASKINPDIVESITSIASDVINTTE